MGSVFVWLDLALPFRRVVFVHTDLVAMYIDRSAARMDYGLHKVYGACFKNGDLYLYLYPVDFENMNLTLEVNYG